MGLYALAGLVGLLSLVVGDPGAPTISVVACLIVALALALDIVVPED